jgi:hypothetical protein
MARTAFVHPGGVSERISTLALCPCARATRAPHVTRGAFNASARAMYAASYADNECRNCQIRSRSGSWGQRVNGKSARS